MSIEMNEKVVETLGGRLQKAQIPPEYEAGAFWSDRIYAAARASVLVPQIFTEVYGLSAPSPEVCPFSFVSRLDLESSAKALEIFPGLKSINDCFRMLDSR